MNAQRLSRIAAGIAIVTALGVVGIITRNVLWPDDPDASLQHQGGKVLGDMTGYVGRVDKESRTVDVSASPLGIRPLAIVLTNETAIVVNGKQGAIGDLWKDLPVRVYYEVRDNTRYATSIQVTSGDAQAASAAARDQAATPPAAAPSTPTPPAAQETSPAPPAPVASTTPPAMPAPTRSVTLPSASTAASPAPASTTPAATSSAATANAPGSPGAAPVVSKSTSPAAAPVASKPAVTATAPVAAKPTPPASLAAPSPPLVPAAARVAEPTPAPPRIAITPPATESASVGSSGAASAAGRPAPAEFESDGSAAIDWLLKETGRR